ncbi:sialidase family protein [Estrella lausannensis]|uniref:Putative secreted protein n=1 Tax=Estrella lausannensis TaxID=483423 RepID=A0A0H5E6T9_9BACT|nr:sialidase family protein [Estrella lausannensis]CRX39005.1 putative secreted protein [Estrella lausannensis]
MVNFLKFSKWIVTMCGLAACLLMPGSSLEAIWLPAETISDPSIDVSALNGPTMGVTPQGNVVAVWVDRTYPPDDRFEDVVMSSFYTPNVGWSAPQVISSLQINTADKQLYSAQDDPDVAINSSNYAVAAWEGEYSEDEFPQVTIAAVRDSNGTWGPVSVISSLSGDSRAVNVNVALNEAGTAVAAWRETYEYPPDGPTVDRTVISILPFGGSWSPFVVISGDEVAFGDSDNKPCVQINADGDIVVVWRRRFEAGVWGIAAATYDATTSTWSSPVTLDTTVSDLSYNPRVAIDSNGNAIAIYSIGNSIKSSYFNGTSWLPPVVVSTDSDETEDPSIVVDPMGNATATWTSNSGQVLSSSLPAGGSWTAPVVISVGDSFTDPFMSQEALAVDADGNVIAIWENDDTGALISAYKLFGQPWQAPETIFSGNDVIYPSIGLASCGLAVAVWQETPEEGLTQVMAAFNGNILTPTNARGKKCCDTFAVQKRCLTKLSWDASDCIRYFNIWKNGQLLTQVPGTAAAKFTDPLGCKGRNIYTISSVNTFGFESARVPFSF